MKRPPALALTLFAATALVLALALLVHKLSPSSWASFEQRVARSVSEQLISLAATKGDRLELASLETVETFRESDELRFGVINLGTTVTEIRVPVVYRFHVALAEGIRISVTKHGDLVRCVVRAPALHATLPPAIRTDGLEKHSENGWGRFNADDNLATMEKNLTAELVLRAPRKAAIARDKAREQLRGFVSRWLIKDGLWGESGIREVVVLFPGESEKELLGG